MSSRPMRFVKPMRCELKLDYEPGTVVRVTTNHEIVKGIVHNNPKHMEGYHYLDLVNSEYVDMAPGEDNYIGLYKVDPDDVVDIKIISAPPPRVVRNNNVEKLHPTIEVDTPSFFEKLLQLIRNEVGVIVDKVGLKFHGVFMGRNGELGWIVLFVDKTIITIDVLKLEKIITNFWETLDRLLFSNTKILKVVHNARPMADFLYHRHCIILTNVFDVQVAEVYTRGQNSDLNAVGKQQKAPEYKSLSKILEEVLPNVALIEEIRLMQDYEKKDFSVKNPLMSRPVTDTAALKWAALDIKYLFKLHDEFVKRVQQPLLHCVSVHLTESIQANNSMMEQAMARPNMIHPNVIKCIPKPLGKEKEKLILKKESVTKNDSKKDTSA